MPLSIVGLAVSNEILKSLAILNIRVCHLWQRCCLSLLITSVSLRRSAGPYPPISGLTDARSRDRIGDIERPHDLKALEYGEDIVLKIKSFSACLPIEIAAMGSQPP